MGSCKDGKHEFALLQVDNDNNVAQFFCKHCLRLEIRDLNFH